MKGSYVECKCTVWVLADDSPVVSVTVHIQAKPTVQAADDLKQNPVPSPWYFTFISYGKLIKGRKNTHGLEGADGQPLSFNVLNFHPLEQLGNNKYEYELACDQSQIDPAAEWSIDIRFCFDLDKSWLDMRRRRHEPRSFLMLEPRAFSMYLNIWENRLLLKGLTENHYFSFHNDNRFEFRYYGLDYTLDFVEGEGYKPPSFVDSRHATIDGIREFSCGLVPSQRTDPARVQAWGIVLSLVLGVVLGSTFGALSSYSPVLGVIILLVALVPAIFFLAILVQAMARPERLEKEIAE